MASKTPLTPDLGPESPPGQAGAFVWTKRHVMALLVLCAAQMLEAIDVTVVNVALPTIKTSLDFSEADLQWVVNAYTVLFGGFLLLGGRSGDLLGRRRVLIGGLSLFTVASLACGLSMNAGMLVGTRALQGLAAGFIAPMTLAMLAQIFPQGPARNKAVAIWGAVAAVSGSLGLIIGGLFVAGPGWSWVFYVNIPIGVLMVLGALRYLAPDGPARNQGHFDVVGAITSTLGLCVFTYAVVQTSTHSWSSGRTIGLLIAAVALLAYFVVHENVFSKEPLVPFVLFRNRTVTGANVVQALATSGLFVMFYVATLFMQQVLHYSAIKTGVLYLPCTVSLVLFAAAVPPLLPKLGVRWVTAIGCAIASVGLYLYSGISIDKGVMGNFIVPSLFLSLGMALASIPITVAAVHGVESALTGVASGMVNVTRTIGGSLGLAIISTVAASKTSDLLGGGQSPDSALTDGFQLAFQIAAVLMAIAGVAAIAFFRDEARGEKVDLAALATAGIDE
ncbi:MULTISPECIES: MFS transporter [Streptomyces]|jgi:EmrB/QacA subfamily drug resistance transporter|uniref:MFS transporter n=1 Tax=Streptomyces doudnae TaxID=3075536 RepID=A0ABD5EY68_9ACTN|nr:MULTISPECIES: MFS transporter [unclassified Streptomyces]MDT0439260.1 MFS transporter [Streptomyces sp. DSM 41981]MYQ65836.1 DHA2 family efflux MFS transporter permease subunit [Streptomyces sp. SID4950]SCE08722.1 drug resistance transporter, EmrB/QacA subfamily [Streptomyces sp. SolWspMP-5a-2]